MNLFFQKDVMMERLKNFMKLVIKIKNFILEEPPGYLEYRKAILSKDESFNYLENEYFIRHIFPYMKGQCAVENNIHSSINHHLLSNHNSAESFKVNPSTGLPMIGAYDAGGSPFGFNYNHLNNTSSFTNLNTTSSLNSFDYWK